MPERYSQRPFPQYRHVPGRSPHPIRDPDGHSYDQDEPDLPSLNDHPWQGCEHYLYGVDLFNAGYWWECHEVIEALWHAAGIGTPAGHVLQAVIQCAAAHLKTRTGQLAGGRRLLAHARKHVAWAEGCDLGLDLPGMLIDTEEYLEGVSADPAYLLLNI